MEKIHTDVRVQEIDVELTPFCFTGLDARPPQPFSVQ